MVAMKYERKLTAAERLFTRSPFSVVTAVMRIKGNVSEAALIGAVSKVRQRHVNLRVRIKEDENHVPWFTTEGAEGIPVDIVPRQSDDHWIQIHLEKSKVPFEFDVRPPIRFILVQSPTVSELIILCHHIICDGLSLAYLARDLMVHLGEPGREVEVLPDPILLDRDNMPDDVPVNGIARFFINRINRKWEADKIFFDREDYLSINQAYWANFHHHILSIELTEEQTTALVERCRQEGVTVNSALSAAFVGAQVIVQGDKPYHSKISVAGSVRDRLKRPAGEVMGFYAGVVNPKFKYDIGKNFWENARQFHQKVKPLYNNKNLLGLFMMWTYLEPAILEALNFKRLGGLVSPQSPRYEKLSTFSRRDDVVLSLLKRDQMESLDRISMGTAITNLTRMDFPRQYGDLELDRLIMQPGGAFPLANVSLVLGAVTCSGKLSLVMEYAEEAVETVTMEQVRDQAMEYLLGK